MVPSDLQSLIELVRLGRSRSDIAQCPQIKESILVVPGYYPGGSRYEEESKNEPTQSLISPFGLFGVNFLS